MNGLICYLYSDSYLNDGDTLRSINKHIHKVDFFNHIWIGKSWSSKTIISSPGDIVAEVVVIKVPLHKGLLQGLVNRLFVRNMVNLAPETIALLEVEQSWINMIESADLHSRVWHSSASIIDLAVLPEVLHLACRDLGKNLVDSSVLITGLDTNQKNFIIPRYISPHVGQILINGDDMLVLDRVSDLLLYETGITVRIPSIDCETIIDMRIDLSERKHAGVYSVHVYNEPIRVLDSNVKRGDLHIRGSLMDVTGSHQEFLELFNLGSFRQVPTSLFEPILMEWDSKLKQNMNGHVSLRFLEYIRDSLFRNGLQIGGYF